MEPTLTRRAAPLLLALLAGACALPPDDAPGTDAGAMTAELEPEAKPIRYYPICSDHFECCHDTKLGDTYDEPGKSRCHFCAERCNDDDDGRGHWPYDTLAGNDCRYWETRYWYREPRDKCRRLPR